MAPELCVEVVEGAALVAEEEPEAEGEVELSLVPLKLVIDVREAVTLLALVHWLGRPD